MNPRILGVVLFVVGLTLLAFGLSATDSVANTLSEGFTGRYTDATMWYLIGGGVLLLAGASMGVFSKGRAATA